MPIDITMPRLSDTMEAGTIIKWNVKQGDKVSAGDVIADVETDTATMEMAVYDDGVISTISVPEGQKVNVGTVIATLSADGEKAETGDERAATSPADKPQARAGGDPARSATVTVVAERPAKSTANATLPADQPSPGDAGDDQEDDARIDERAVV